MNQVFLSYNDNTLDFAETIAQRLHGDARLDFWFEPWHGIPGVPTQEQMEKALWDADACAIFIGDDGDIVEWQSEQMRVAIQTRVEDDPRYRVIPVLLPGVKRRALPMFLRRHQPVKFTDVDDERAFKTLLAGIMGIPPIQVPTFLDHQQAKYMSGISSDDYTNFTNGHALVIGIADYPHIKPLPETVRHDAEAMYQTLTDTSICGYPAGHVTQLLDTQATSDGIRDALVHLAKTTTENDTAVIFFSGHGFHNTTHDSDSPDYHETQYILPYEAELHDLAHTALRGDEFTALINDIPAGRLLVLLDCCHSGGAATPKQASDLQAKQGLREEYYQSIAQSHNQSQGRVVMAACRPSEYSWVLPGMPNSLFTHHLLEALRGEHQPQPSQPIRVFDLFRHVAEQVPRQAETLDVSQHPIFKASRLEGDFAITQSI